MTEESSKEMEIELKLKARLVHVDDVNYTLQIFPINNEWKYADTDLEYVICNHKFKNDAIRQIVRNILLKNKELVVGTIKVGSKDYLFEVQAPKGIQTEKLKLMFTQIATEIKNEILRSKKEQETFRKFIEENEF